MAPSSADDILLVLTTVGTDEQAERIAAALVEERLAACVNIVPGVRSVYRWKGEVCRDEERLLVIKTTGPAFDALRGRIRELHAYEMPEIVAIRPSAGDPAYLNWLRESVGPG
jgi:periplasmic divalent cation tolerance protein